MTFRSVKDALKKTYETLIEKQTK